MRGTRTDEHPRPAEGWSEPDARGHVRFTVHGPSTFIRAPKREGYESYFVAVHGQNYTSWVYKPTTKEITR